MHLDDPVGSSKHMHSVIDPLAAPVPAVIPLETNSTSCYVDKGWICSGDDHVHSGPQLLMLQKIPQPPSFGLAPSRPLKRGFRFFFRVDSF